MHNSLDVPHYRVHCGDESDDGFERRRAGLT
jgi:hypothetical protein